MASASANSGAIFMSELPHSSESPSRGEFALHLPGLLKVLAEHLYSNRQVALRELIQNAGDSCVRRALSGDAPQGYAPRLDIRLDRAAGTLEFSDNGSGLTEDEIRDYLATIGRSQTRELKENLAIFSPDDAQKLVGQFGFGFLSAFLLASHVEVVTRSMQPDSPALLWRAQGDESYEMSRAQRDEIGTTITLRVKPEAAYLLERELLGETLRRFADFLPLPITLDGADEPLNAGRPPWEGDDPAHEIGDYIRARFHAPPLVIIRLGPHQFDLGHDTLEIPLEGFLFVPPGSVASVREYGDLSVFIRGMFIRDDEKHLLPSWARFVRGVIDCPDLQPTASREDIHQDETFGWVKKAIEAQLVSALHGIADEEPQLWQAIVRGHADVITGWAARDEEFFERVADILSFRTTRGLLTLRDYLNLSDGALYYVTRELGSLQEQLLAEGHGFPVIDASWFGVEGCLRRFAATRLHDEKRVRLVQLDDNAPELLRAAPSDSLQAVLRWYEARGVRVKVARFAPDSVPALMVYPRDAQFIADARTALSGDELPAPFAGLIGEVVESLPVEEDDLAGVLHLNLDNSLVQSLADAPVDARRGAVLETLLQVGRLFAGRTLTVGDAAGAFEELGAALGRLMLEE